MYDKYPLSEDSNGELDLGIFYKFFNKERADLPRRAALPLRSFLDIPKRPSVSVEQRTIVTPENNPVFAHLHSFHRRGATAAATVLNLSEGLGHLDLSKSKRILDFGAGSGGPTLALAELAKLNGGTVDAIESKPRLARDIVDLGILPAERVITGNGIEALRTTPEKYDLITSFMLGPDDSDGSLARALLDSGRHALVPGGSILITSDVNTIATVKRVCEQDGVPHDYIHGLPVDDGFLPGTVIASFPASN